MTFELESTWLPPNRSAMSAISDHFASVTMKKTLASKWEQIGRYTDPSLSNILIQFVHYIVNVNKYQLT